eukprot:c11429_g1_i3.p3 GENE.c11429_g1_i3~~c11429_g1_i3.p3  ORF type:complete len:104 (-),score=15.81 c11429_g1_i3:853-1164(-)
MSHTNTNTKKPHNEMKYILSFFVCVFQIKKYSTNVSLATKNIFLLFVFYMYSFSKLKCTCHIFNKHVLFGSVSFFLNFFFDSLSSFARIGFFISEDFLQFQQI